MADLSTAIQKRKAGTKLTTAEAKVLKDDAARRRARMIPLYFTTEEEKEEFAKLAKKDGFKTFSKWATIRIREAAQGGHISKDQYEALRRDYDQVRKWYEVEKEKVAKLDREKDDLNRRMQGLVEMVADLMTKVGK